MSKISELETAISDLRTAAATINDVADTLTGMFSSKDAAEPTAAEAPVEEKQPLTKDEVSILVVPEVCCWVWQHPNMGAVVLPDRALAAANDRGNKLVKFAVPAYQELHIFFLLQELADQRFKALFYHKRIFDDSVAKE